MLTGGPYSQSRTYFKVPTIINPTPIAIRLTCWHRRAVIRVAGDVNDSAGAAVGAGDSGARLATPTRRALVGAQLEAVVAAHAAGQI